MDDKYKWGMGTMLPDGHRIFTDMRTDNQGNYSRQVAIADDSGREPQDTTDGVLWLDFESRLIIDSEDGHEFFFIPVFDAKLNSHKTISNATTLLWLSKEYEWPIFDKVECQTFMVRSN